MFHRFLLALAGVLALSALVSSVSHAGNNAGGQVFLSWDRAGMDSVLTKVPAAPFPLFLHLRDAPDVHALAARIIWTTNTEGAPPCYTLVSSSAPDLAPAPDSLRGWAFDTPPGQDFDGDTTYTWTISFDAEDEGKNCVEYRVSGAACADTACAGFLAASVMVMDALGRIDTLAVVGGARIVPRVIRLAVEQVSPTHVSLGQAADLTIAGHGFEPGSRVFLQRGGQRIEASQVAVSDTTEMVARVVSPFSAGDSLDLVVEHATGAEALLRAGLQSIGSSAESATLLTPSNDAFAFTQLDLHASNREAVGIADPVSHPEWPDSLDSPNLLVVRAPGDTVALIRSQPHNCIGLEVDPSVGDSSWVRFRLDPPCYATSLATLATTGRTFNDYQGQFADAGKPALQVTVRYVDGDSSVSLLRVGTHVRNWESGQIICSGGHYFYDWLPTDSLVVPLLSLPDYHYDLQETRLPVAKRNKRLASVEFLAEPLPRNPSGGCPQYYGTSALSGVAVWPEFEIVSREGDAIVPQYQNDASWATVRYGGYRDPFTGNIVGAYRAIGGEGCFLADLAMALTYVGVPMTVLALNDTLQRSNGFDVERICDITSVSGQAPGDTVGISKPPGRSTLGVPAWTDFVIDRDGRSYSGALATLTVVDSAHAIILTHPDTSLYIAPGQEGCVYREVRVGDVARGLTAGCAASLAFDRYGPSRDPATAVEEALVDSLPSLLFVGTRDVPHWALATGWHPVFGDSGVARGTYSLVDPDLQCGTTSLLVRSGNVLGGAWVGRYAADTLQKSMANMAARTTQSGEATLTLWLTGEASLSLTESAGGYMRYDEATEDYETNIAGAFGVRSANPGTVGGSSGEDVPADMLVLPVTVATQYAVAALASTDGTVSLTGTCRTGDAYAGHDAAGATLTSGGRGYFNLSVDPSASEPVSLRLTGTVGVPQIASPIEFRLRIVPTPSVTSPRIYFDLPSRDRVQVEIFDVAGRRVRRLVDGIIESGAHVLVWDGHDDAGGTCGAGIFLVRAQTAGGSRVVRCVRVGP